MASRRPIFASIHYDLCNGQCVLRSGCVRPRAPFRELNGMHPRLFSDSKPAAVALTEVATNHTISYRELEQRANRVAHALRSLGLVSGDTLGLLCNNCPEFMDVYWGAQRCGVTLVPLSTRLTPN